MRVVPDPYRHRGQHPEGQACRHPGDLQHQAVTRGGDAPGQPVTLSLGFEPGQVTVSADNPLPKGGTPGPLAAAGAGAGLAGLTERAAMAGGTFEAGPTAGSWRVCLRIPA
jgi:hypothetical protein